MGPIQLIRQATPGQRGTLLAASLGWALDAFDAMLYALVLALLMRDLGMSKTTAGLLSTLTLLASGIGGILFGFLAAGRGEFFRGNYCGFRLFHGLDDNAILSCAAVRALHDHDGREDEENS
jgi:MFS family permease